VRYTVLWRPSAEQNLAEIWTKAVDRGAVARAADSIDRLLAQDPVSQGESRAGNTRVLLVEPLGVYFDVEADDRRVWVFDVWQHQP
jgi:plasmid stabilization system protein ParE